MRLKTSALYLVAILAMACNAAASATGSFSKTLAVSGTAQIDIATGSGKISILKGTGDTVKIYATIKASEGWFSGGLSADEKIKRIEANPPIEQSGNHITIGKGLDEDLRNNVSISYELTVPDTTRLEAQTGSGEVNIESIRGPVRASTGSGNIEMGTISGEVNARTGSGSITVEGAEGRVSANTGSGSIHLHGVNGGLRAGTGSGSIEADGDSKSDWDLHTGSGSIKVRTMAKGFHLDAHSGSGSVTVSRPITMSGSISKSHVDGEVGSGGSLIHLRTGSGSIEVE